MGCSWGGKGWKDATGKREKTVGSLVWTFFLIFCCCSSFFSETYNVLCMPSAHYYTVHSHVQYTHNKLFLPCGVTEPELPALSAYKKLIKILESKFIYNFLQIMYFINPNRKYISLKHLILYSSLNAASVEEPELFPLSLKKSYTLFIFTKNNNFTNTLQ